MKPLSKLSACVIGAILIVATLVPSADASVTIGLDARDVGGGNADLSRLGFATQTRPDGVRLVRFWIETYGGRIWFGDVWIEIDTNGDGTSDRAVLCNESSGCWLDDRTVRWGVRDINGHERWYVVFKRRFLHPTAKIGWNVRTHDGTEEGADAAPGYEPSDWYRA